MSMSNVVVDSSVIVKWISQDNEKLLDEADKILKDSERGKIVLIAPELVKYEIGNVLLFGKHLSPEQAVITLTEFYNLPISFIPESKEVAKATFRLAFDLNITYYDASFISLARQYNATLVTDNIKHQGKDPSIKVVALKDY